MSDIAIHCDGIAEQYGIGEGERHNVLRDVNTNAIKG